MHVERAGLCNMIDHGMVRSDVIGICCWQLILLLELLIQRFVLINDLCLWHQVLQILILLVFLVVDVLVVGGSLGNHLEVAMHFLIEIFIKKVAIIVLAWVHCLQWHVHLLGVSWHLHIIGSSIVNSTGPVIEGSLGHVHCYGGSLRWRSILLLRVAARWRPLRTCSWQADLWMLVLEGCEDLLPLCLPLASLLPSFFLSLAELLSVPLLALPNLVAEIQRS